MFKVVLKFILFIILWIFCGGSTIRDAILHLKSNEYFKFGTTIMLAIIYLSALIITVITFAYQMGYLYLWH